MIQACSKVKRSVRFTNWTLQMEKKTWEGAKHAQKYKQVHWRGYNDAFADTWCSQQEKGKPVDLFSALRNRTSVGRVILSQLVLRQLTHHALTSNQA